MSRGKFAAGIMLAGLLLAGLTADVARLDAAEAQSKPKRAPIKYAREKIPSWKMPAYRGRYYKARVPDTLDLAERARISLEGIITRSCDPDYDYETYQEATLGQGVPFMYHSFHDFNGCEPKYIEDMPLLRTMTGSKVNLDTDRGMFRALTQMIGEDGLAYSAVKGRPWALFDCWNSVLRDVNKPPKDVEQIFSLWPNGRAFLALTVWSLHDPNNKFIRQLMDDMARGAREISVEQNGVRWFPFELMYQTGHGPLAAVGTYGGSASAPAPVKQALEEALKKGLAATPAACCDASPMLQAIMRYYRLTRDPQAAETAKSLAQYIKHAYRKDGKFQGDGKYAPQWGHIHSNCMALTGLLDYAVTFNDEHLKQVAKGGFEYARDFGVPLIGYFPHFNGQTRDLSAVEGCNTGDMLLLASKLTEYGVGDYWEDIDRCLRNHFAESQLTDVSWLANREKAPGVLAAIPGQALPDQELLKRGRVIGVHPEIEVKKLGLLQYPSFLVERGVAERVRGAFSTGGPVDEWGGGDISGCCHANCCRGLYFAWRSILDYDKDRGRLRVNLLLNRVSPWADVNSHIPYKGQVDILMKKAARLQVRIPLWVQDQASVAVTVDGQPIAAKPEWQGRYVNVGQVKAKSKVTLSFPISERTVTVEGAWGGGKTKMTFTIKGNDVVDISHRGTNQPAYMREKYRQNETKWIDVTRFETDEIFPI